MPLLTCPDWLLWYSSCFYQHACLCKKNSQHFSNRNAITSGSQNFLSSSPLRKLQYQQDRKHALLDSLKSNPCKRKKKITILQISRKILPRPRIEPAISFIIFWDFSMFYQIFLSPQVKRCAIITYEHGTYELPHELPNDLGS